MAAENGAVHTDPSWFVAPGQADHFAWLALGFLFGAIYLVVVLYAAFDRWAERQSHGTPLAKTIPTLLTIAMLYEIFPLGHFNTLLPISAILIALMADWSRYHGLSLKEEDATAPPDEPMQSEDTSPATPAPETGNA